MLFRFRRREAPWEVVDSKSVNPVPMYYEDEGEPLLFLHIEHCAEAHLPFVNLVDFDIISTATSDTCGTYVFDVKHWKRGNELRNAVLFAQKQLLQSAAKQGYNILLLESWRITILRKGKHHRVEVWYSGRPARAEGKLPSRRAPPFIGVLGGDP
ncbi:hypothetical protein ONZ45_g9605 [Pleurotus djamor]|nr:hypothetical protein ONZ45_g9605 [Pleurotus djamor]